MSLLAQKIMQAFHITNFDVLRSLSWDVYVLEWKLKYMPHNLYGTLCEAASNLRARTNLDNFSYDNTVKN